MGLETAIGSLFAAFRALRRRRPQSLAAAVHERASRPARRRRARRALRHPLLDARAGAAGSADRRGLRRRQDPARRPRPAPGRDRCRAGVGRDPLRRRDGARDRPAALVAVLLGGATAGSIHAGRSAVRPVSTATTGGIANPSSRSARISPRSCSSSPRSSCPSSRCCSCSRSRVPFRRGSAGSGGDGGRPCYPPALAPAAPLGALAALLVLLVPAPAHAVPDVPLDVYLEHVEPLALDWPADGTMTDGYGPRWGRMHLGVDVGILRSLDVRAAASGTVTAAGWRPATRATGTSSRSTSAAATRSSTRTCRWPRSSRANGWTPATRSARPGARARARARTCTSSCASTRVPVDPFPYLG